MANIESMRFSNPTIVANPYPDATFAPFHTYDGTQSLPLSRQFPDAVSGSSVIPSIERPREGEGTAAWINYFDTYWQKEGLPPDWYNLKSQQSQKRVGFIMSRQMDLLKNLFDRESVLDWAQKTRRDLQGFKLEFLSDHIVYPRKYEIVHSTNPSISTRIEDPMYGKAKDPRYKHEDIEEIISEEERNGSVKRAIKEVKDFLSTAPVGAMTVMTSPLGPTGFKTDDGLGIDYPDSYFFVKVKTSPTEIMNYTIKTNFNLKECRAAIAKLTGIELPKGSPLEAYAEALTKINPGEQDKPQNIFDVINILQQIHPEAPFMDKQNGKITNWKEVYDDIAHGEDLYRFDKETTQIIDEFSAYAKQDSIRTKLDYQKAIAATILNMAKHFFTPKEEVSTEKTERRMVPDGWVRVERNSGSFGNILEQTAERRGCSGGGQTKTVSTDGGERLAKIKGPNDMKCVTCPFCEETVDAIVEGAQIFCPRSECEASKEKKNGIEEKSKPEIKVEEKTKEKTTDKKDSLPLGA